MKLSPRSVSNADDVFAIAAKSLQQKIIEIIKEKLGISPRDLELRFCPANATPRDVRVALQQLILTGNVAFDDSLKLVVLTKGE
jgi:hypothetical protein